MEKEERGTIGRRRVRRECVRWPRREGEIERERERDRERDKDREKKERVKEECGHTHTIFL